MAGFCAVYGCPTTSNNKDRYLYAFPLEEDRCSAWLQAIGRPDLAHLGVHNLHNEYRVCDIHFGYLDHNRLVLDNAVPNINLPQQPTAMININYLPTNINCQMNTVVDSSKCTQTEFSSITESTQTHIETKEIACQTEILYCQETQQWKIDNPLKRKLLITLAIDPKEAKQSETVDQSASLLSTYNISSLKNDDFTGNLPSQASSEAVMCQPDISSIVEENNPNKHKNEHTKSKQLDDTTLHMKSNAKKVKPQQVKIKPKLKRKCTRKSKSEHMNNVPLSKLAELDDSSDFEQEEDNTENDSDNAAMSLRLEEAIKLIQQQWNIHEKKYRKDKTNDNTPAVEDPVEKLKIKQGRSYGKELKFLALNLFYSNPTAYRALRQHLNLPTEKTLRRIEVGISTKLTPTVLSLLKLIVSKMKDAEKICVMCANILPLKEELHKIANSDKSMGHHEINEVQGWAPACKTLVVIIQGLYADWKQPLITCYLREHFDLAEVNLWLDNIIMSLQEIGLKVVGFTTNEHPNLLNMAKERNISTLRPYFYVNNEKIFYFFDISHLLNSLRNLLINNYFRYIEPGGTEQIASWFDIEKLFETDKTRAYKLAPKLTENHIRPNTLDKTRIQFAAQVFSRTVAAGIINCIDTKHLTAKGYGTVRLVELLNDVYDILTSYDEDNPCQFKNPFCFKDYQMDALEKLLNLLPSLKIITKNYEDLTLKIETLKCLEITLRSFIILATDLKIMGHQYIQAKNLNLDHLDVFFESMRRKWGFKPTAVLFYAGFRNFFLENIIKKSESNDSCGLDKDLIEILLKDNSNSNVNTNDAGHTSQKDFNPFFKYL